MFYRLHLVVRKQALGEYQLAESNLDEFSQPNENSQAGCVCHGCAPVARQVCFVVVFSLDVWL